jgi:hypothetical protein
MKKLSSLKDFGKKMAYNVLTRIITSKQVKKDMPN